MASVALARWVGRIETPSPPSTIGRYTWPITLIATSIFLVTQIVRWALWMYAKAPIPALDVSDQVELALMAPLFLIAYLDHRQRRQLR